MTRDDGGLVNVGKIGGAVTVAEGGVAGAVGSDSSSEVWRRRAVKFLDEGGRGSCEDGKREEEEAKESYLERRCGSHGRRERERRSGSLVQIETMSICSCRWRLPKFLIII